MMTIDSEINVKYLFTDITKYSLYINIMVHITVYNDSCKICFKTFDNIARYKLILKKIDHYILHF